MKTKLNPHIIVLLCSLLICSTAHSQCNAPIIDIDGELNATVCSGSTVDLRIIYDNTPCDTLGTQYDYEWSNGSSGTNLLLTTITLPVNTSSSAIDTIYSVIVMDGPTPIGSGSITISVLPEMSVSIAAEASPPLCIGNDINLIATVTGGSGTGFSTNWTNVDTENVLQAVDLDVAEGTLYGISVTDSEGCSASVSNVSFTIDSLPPPISITGDLGHCVGDTMTLNINPTNPDFACAWTKNGNSTPSTNCVLIRDPITQIDLGDYIVTVTNTNTQCVRQSTAVTVQVNPLTVTIDPDIGPGGVCANDGPIPLNLTPNLGTLNPFTLTTSPPSTAIVGDDFHPQISGPDIFIIT